MPIALIKAGAATDTLGLAVSGTPTERVTLTSGVLDSQWNLVAKTADETISTDTSLNNDAELTFSVANSTRVAFRGTLFFTTTAGGDFKYAVDASSAPTFWRFATYAIGNGANVLDADDVETSDGTAHSATGTGTDGCIWFHGLIYNNTGSAITVTVQWAQNFNDVGDTTLRAGSFLEYRSVG